VADGKAATVTYRTFGMESGMKNTSMIVPNQPAAAKAGGGRLWFGTGEGAAVVDPASLTLYPDYAAATGDGSKGA